MCPTKNEENSNDGLDDDASDDKGDSSDEDAAECSGSLIVTHAILDGLLCNNQKTILPGKRKEFPNLARRLGGKKRIVLSIQARGTCCWQIFSKLKYKGMRTQDIAPGGEPIMLNVLPRSVKQKECVNR